MIVRAPQLDEIRNATFRDIAEALTEKLSPESYAENAELCDKLHWLLTLTAHNHKVKHNLGD